MNDPYVKGQIERLNKLYNNYSTKNFIVSTSPIDLQEHNIKTILIDNWNESFEDFLNELLKNKNNSQKVDSITKENIDNINDILVLQKILTDKSEEYKRSNDQKKKELANDLYKISDRISEIQARELELNFQVLIPNHKEEKLEYLFNSIFNSEKISSESLKLNERVRDVESREYDWYHRSVVVSALACSIINYSKLDPKKINLLIDFVNDSEEKVWL